MWKLKRLRWPQYSLARSSPWRRAVLRGLPNAWLCSDSWGVHVAVPLFKRGALAIAAVSLAASSSSCVLTGDLPDLSLDVPQRYKAAELLDPDGATPTLDWWRGFRWNELTQLMEEAQTVNLDIASAVSRIRQADAQARIAGAPLLPNISEPVRKLIRLPRARVLPVSLAAGARPSVFRLRQAQVTNSISGAGTATPLRPPKRRRLPAVSIVTWWR
jgi:hypothetical protein